ELRGLLGVGDVRRELVPLELELSYPGFHHVTDRDDAVQLTVGEDRDVPDPVLGHQLHQVVHAVGRSRGLHLGGHDRGDVAVEQVGATGQSANYVALGHDAGDGVVV